MRRAKSLGIVCPCSVQLLELAESGEIYSEVRHGLELRQNFRLQLCDAPVETVALDNSAKASAMSTLFRLTRRSFLDLSGRLNAAKLAHDVRSCEARHFPHHCYRQVTISIRRSPGSGCWVVPGERTCSPRDNELPPHQGACARATDPHVEARAHVRDSHQHRSKRSGWSCRQHRRPSRPVDMALQNRPTAADLLADLAASRSPCPAREQSVLRRILKWRK